MNTMKQTVFLVDDDTSVLRTLPRGLRRRGLQVEAFDSAQAFLSAYSDDYSGCLLLDLSMPDMNGLELQQELIARGIQIPIIFITGHGSVPESVQAVRAGAIDFLEKPFAPEILLERIELAFSEDTKMRIAKNEHEEIVHRFEKLTNRENEILDHLLSDPIAVSSKKIAEKLNISPRTVEQHRARILEKTQTISLADLTHLARQVGIGAREGESTD